MFSDQESLNEFYYPATTDNYGKQMVSPSFSSVAEGMSIHPIYRQTAAYGHFGRTDVDLPWEHTDYVDELRKKAGL